MALPWGINLAPDTSTTTLVLIGVAIVGAFVVMKVISKGKKKDEGEKESQSSEQASLQSYKFAPGMLAANAASLNLDTPNSKVKVMPYIDFNSSIRQLGHKNAAKIELPKNTFVLGVTASF